jgi:hypothetical protein
MQFRHTPPVEHLADKPTCRDYGREAGSSHPMYLPPLSITDRLSCKENLEDHAYLSGLPLMPDVSTPLFWSKLPQTLTPKGREPLCSRPHLRDSHPVVPMPGRHRDSKHFYILHCKKYWGSFSYAYNGRIIMKTTAEKILKEIRAHGRNWAFTGKDFQGTESISSVMWRSA